MKRVSHHIGPTCRIKIFRFYESVRKVEVFSPHLFLQPTEIINQFVIFIFQNSSKIFIKFYEFFLKLPPFFPKTFLKVRLIFRYFLKEKMVNRRFLKAGKLDFMKNFLQGLTCVGRVSFRRMRLLCSTTLWDWWGDQVGNQKRDLDKKW